MDDFTQSTPRLSGVLLAAIRWLFAEMTLLYGVKWTERWKPETQEVWARGLIAFSPDDIKRAHQLWLEQGSRWPPQAPAEFAALYRKSREAKAPRLGPEYDPPPTRDDSPKGLAWRAVQRAYAMRIMGVPVGPSIKTDFDADSVANLLGLPKTGDLEEHQRAFARLKREFERVWLESAA